MGLSGLWIGLTVALIYCAGFGVVMSVWTPDWEEEVRKVTKRVELDQEREQEHTESVISDTDDGSPRKRDRRWVAAEEGRVSRSTSYGGSEHS